MKIQPFQLERYFALYEFSAPYLLSCSDCEALSMKEVLSMADSGSLAMWNDLTLGYTHSDGNPVLREEIAKLYQNLSPDETLVMTPEEGIFIAMNTLLEKGDHVITTFPGYQSLYEIARSLGCEVSKWIPEEQTDWIFNVSDLSGLIRSNTKMIAVNFPHNPTGSIIQKDEMKEIIRLAEKNNIILFSDEMYRFLEYEADNRLPAAYELYDRAVSLSGVSKNLALAGLRIGWLATKNREFYKQFSIFKDYTTICSSAPAEILAIMALRAKDQILKRNLSIITHNLRLLDDFFTRYEKLFEWHKPKAGTIAFPKLKCCASAGEFCLDLVQKKGVMLLPSEVYDYNNKHFRIGFGRKNLPEALMQFEEYVTDQHIVEQ